MLKNQNFECVCVDPGGIEPPTLRLSSVRSNQLSYGSGGADQDRTGDLLLAKQALSQLSYSPNSIIKKLNYASV